MDSEELPKPQTTSGYLISCPLDSTHRMKAQFLPNHLQKCKKKLKLKGVATNFYTCRYYFLHVFLTETALNEHEKDCCVLQETKNQKESEMNGEFCKMLEKSKFVSQYEKGGGWGVENQEN